MTAARTIEEDTAANYASLQSARHEDDKAFEKRGTDRSDMVRLVEQMAMMLDDVHKPQDPIEQVVTINFTKIPNSTPLIQDMHNNHHPKYPISMLCKCHQPLDKAGISTMRKAEGQQKKL